jgi:hypothetical protein
VRNWRMELRLSIENEANLNWLAAHWGCSRSAAIARACKVARIVEGQIAMAETERGERRA